MRNRKRRQDKCLIYPDDPKKAKWDLVITLVLMLTCIITPINIAFTYDKEDEF